MVFIDKKHNKEKKQQETLYAYCSMRKFALYCLTTVNVFEFANRNFRVLPIIWIRKLAGKCNENIQVDIRMSEIKPICEIIYSWHRHLVKYHENITSQIISKFRVFDCTNKMYISIYLWSFLVNKFSRCD